MRNRFLPGLIALAFCCAIALHAYAQSDPTPEKKALIKELLGLMNAGFNSEAVSNQMMGQLQAPVASLISNEMRGWIRAQKLTPAEQKRLEAEVDELVQRVLTRVRAEFPKRVNYREIAEKVMLETYDKYFTEAEVKDLIAFYKTSTAQKFIRLTPQITAEMFPRLENLIGPEMAKLINESVDDELMRLKTKRK
ncbi:MAG TPA: DUF2059 domain-containing protein [Blastocatellia bacterium]|nr:DUF2059 domain-containing protein [Blastocatellia bacterium]